MIAYCPLIKPSTCGLTSTDHKLEVSLTTPTKISLIADNAIKTKSGTIKTGLYDACYWELSAAPSPGNCIHIKVTKAKNVKSYFYGGDTRSEATVSIVEDNSVLKAGETYHVPTDKGGLLTALPVLGETDTEFEFEYFIAPTPVDSSNVPMIVGIVVGVLAVLIIICAVMKIRKNK